MGSTDGALASPAAGDTLTRAGHAAVEVHTVDTNTGVVLDAQVDVLADTEAEVAGLGEVALAELVLLDLEATLDDLLGLGTTDGDVDGNLFVTADTEGSDSVASLACKPGCEKGILIMFAIGRVGSFETYCRLGFDRSTARAPWRHESICHQTRQQRC